MGLIGKEILEKCEAMEKSIHEQQKAEFVYLCVREEKNFEITVIILRYIRNFNLSYSKRILKIQNFYQNILFFTVETVLKIAKETNKGDIESICGRVTKPVSKNVVNAEVYLN